MNLTTLIDEYQPSYIQSLGAAHAVSADQPPADVAEQLRRVVEEVTGKPVEAPARPRMGFLP